MQMQQTSAWCVAAGGRRWAGVWACAVVCVSLGACADEAAAASTSAAATTAAPKHKTNLFYGFDHIIDLYVKAGVRIGAAVDELLGSVNFLKRGDILGLCHTIIKAMHVFASRFPKMTRNNKIIRHLIHLDWDTERDFEQAAYIFQAIIESVEAERANITVKPSAAPGVTGDPSQPTMSPQRKAVLDLLESIMGIHRVQTMSAHTAFVVAVVGRVHDSIQSSPHFFLDGVHAPSGHEVFVVIKNRFSALEQALRHSMPGTAAKPTEVTPAKPPTTSAPKAEANATAGSSSTGAPRDAHGARNSRLHTAAIALCVAAAVVACCVVAVGVGRWRKAAAGALRTVWGSDADDQEVELVSFGAEHEGGAGAGRGALGKSRMPSAAAAANIEDWTTFT